MSFQMHDRGIHAVRPAADSARRLRDQIWAALHQDAIVVQLPDRSGPLAGEPAAALLRRGFQ